MTNRQFSSNAIRLGRVAGALAGTLLLATACEENNDTGRAYPSVEKCIEGNVYTADFCRQSFRQAADDYTRQVPAYQSREDCQQDWARCEEVQPPQPSSPDQSAVASAPPPANAHPHGGGSAFFFLNSTYYRPPMDGVLMGTQGGSSGAARTTFAEPASRVAGGGMRGMTTQTSFTTFGTAVTRVSPAVAASPARPAFTAGSSISRGGFVSGARAGGGASVGG